MEPSQRRRSTSLVVARLAGAGVLAAAALVAGALAGTPADPAGAAGIPSDAVPGAGFTRTGDAPDTAELHLALGLTRDGAALEARAVAVSDPDSPSYGDHLTLAELRAVAGTGAPGAVALDVLAAAGIDAWVDPTGLFVHATPTVAEAESLFGTTWGTYRGPGMVADIEYLAADTAPALPPALDGALAELTGFTMARPSTTIPTAAATALPPAPTNTGTAAGCAAALATGGYTQAQLATAYGIDPAAAPGGHVAVLIDGDGFEPAAYAELASCYGIGLPAPDVHVVAPQRAPIQGSLGELDGDVQTVAGVAPTLGRLDVLQGVYGPYQWPLLFAAALDPAVTGSPPHAVTMSDGDPETQIPDATISLLEDVFVASALVGTTVAAPAGDFGSVSFPGVPGNPQSYPASSPWVVSIGGTNATLDRDNRITSELVWNDTRYQGFDTQATGGGPSTRFAAPPWQSGTARGLPDVSLFAAAYPGATQVLDLDGDLQWYAASGTSFASPLFATGVALTDAQLEAAGRPRLGLLTPLLYDRADALWASGAIVDITEGSNDLDGIGCCTATVGVDLASGVGAPRFDRLLDAALTIGLEPLGPASTPTTTAAAAPSRAVPTFTG